MVEPEDYDLARALGKEIAASRARRGMTQAQLAEAVGMGVNTVARYERAQTMPNVPETMRIARALGTSIERMIGAALEEIAADSDGLDSESPHAPESTLSTLLLEAFLFTNQGQPVPADNPFVKFDPSEIVRISLKALNMPDDHREKFAESQLRLAHRKQTRVAARDTGDDPTGPRNQGKKPG